MREETDGTAEARDTGEAARKRRLPLVLKRPQLPEEWWRRAALAVLFAPRAGRETREMIADRVKDGLVKGRDLKDEVVR